MYIFPSGFLSATNQAVTSAGTAISNANCDGVRWLLRWSDVEATPDIYTWQYLDDAVAWAATNNKKCGISINAGKDCPAWLYAAPYNAQFYTMQDTPGAVGRTIPVPGDPVFMTRWQKFITDFGARYDSNPAGVLRHNSRYRQPRRVGHRARTARHGGSRLDAGGGGRVEIIVEANHRLLHERIP